MRFEKVDVDSEMFGGCRCGKGIFGNGNIFWIFTIHTSFHFICNYLLFILVLSKQGVLTCVQCFTQEESQKSHNLTGSQISIPRRQSFSFRKRQVLAVRKQSKSKILSFVCAQLFCHSKCCNTLALGCVCNKCYVQVIISTGPI